MSAAADALAKRVRARLELLDPDGLWSLEAVCAVVAELDPLGSPTRRRELAEELRAELVGLGPVAGLLARPGVTDVLVNGPGPVWIEQGGRLEATSVVLDAAGVARLVERTLGPLGRRVDPSAPIADAAMADGTRVAVVVPPVALGGPVLAYRRFEVRAVPLASMATPLQVAALERVVAQRHNVLVFGGTGAGKTTLLDALCSLLPAEERLVVVEDTAELAPPGRHLVRLEARRANAEGSGSVELGDLVRAALRLRPDRLVVGEVRGGEAADLVTALSTGHDGGLSTLHAGTPAEALDRLESLTLLGAPGLGVAGIRRRLHSAVDVLVGVARRGDGTRGVTGVWGLAGTADAPEFLALDDPKVQR
ncbi:MAG: ATPase, T2SS/T4P/T4SS family [Microthrixaceae bacterium]